MTFLTPGCGGTKCTPSGLERRRTLVDITQVFILKSSIQKCSFYGSTDQKAPEALHPVLCVLCLALSPICPTQEGSASITSLSSGMNWDRSFHVVFFFLFWFYLFLEREEGREKERERNRNRTCDLLVCRPALNPLMHTSQGSCFVLLFFKFNLLCTFSPLPFSSVCFCERTSGSDWPDRKC